MEKSCKPESSLQEIDFKINTICSQKDTIYRLPFLLKTLIKMRFFCFFVLCISTAAILDQKRQSLIIAVRGDVLNMTIIENLPSLLLLF